MPRPRTPAEAAAAVPGATVQPAVDTIPSYMIQPGQTPKQVEMRRRMAQSLMEQGTSTAPLQGGGWIEAAARPLTAFIAGAGEYGAAQEEKRGQRSAAQALSEALTGDKIQPQQLAGFFGNEWASPGQQSVLASIYEQQQKPLDPIKVGKDDILLDPVTHQPIYQPDQAASAGLYDSKSVEGQALNYLIQTGVLSKEEAAQIGAGKPITAPDGSLRFLTPGEIVEAARRKAGGGGGAPAPAPDATAPAPVPAPDATAPAPVPAPVPPDDTAGIPLTPAKKSESEIKGGAIKSGVETSVGIVNQPGAFEELASWRNTASGAGIGRPGMSDKGKAVYDATFNIVQNYTYALSGAQAPDSEVMRNFNSVMPGITDGPEAIAGKKARLQDMIRTINERASGPMATPQKQAQPKERRYNPNTGLIE